MSGNLGIGRTGNSPLSSDLLRPFYFRKTANPLGPPVSRGGNPSFTNSIGGIPESNLNIRRIELPQAQFGNSMDLWKREWKKKEKEFPKEPARTDLVDKAGEKNGKEEKKKEKRKNLCLPARRIFDVIGSAGFL